MITVTEVDPMILKKLERHVECATGQSADRLRNRLAQSPLPNIRREIKGFKGLLYFHRLLSEPRFLDRFHQSCRHAAGNPITLLGFVKDDIVRILLESRVYGRSLGLLRTY